MIDSLSVRDSYSQDEVALFAALVRLLSGKSCEAFSDACAYCKCEHCEREEAKQVLEEYLKGVNV